MHNPKTIYRTTIKQQLLVLAYSIFALTVILFVYFVYLSDLNSERLVFWVMFFLVLLNIVPVIVLHVQYYLYSRNIEVLIDEVERVISVNKNGVSFSRKFDDVKSIKFYATSGHISTKGSSLWYTFDPYRYYKIVFKDKTSVNITCLMGNKIDRQIEISLGMDAERTFRPIPLIY